jgi:hypothetical protein
VAPEHRIHKSLPPFSILSQLDPIYSPKYNPSVRCFHSLLPLFLLQILKVFGIFYMQSPEGVFKKITLTILTIGVSLPPSDCRHPLQADTLNAIYHCGQHNCQ